MQLLGLKGLMQTHWKDKAKCRCEHYRDVCITVKPHLFYFLDNKQYYIYIISFYRSMDGVEEDEYTSDPIAQQTRQVRVFL